MIRPSVWGGMAKVLDVIWGVRKQKYFCKQDWTASISLIRFNKFAVARKSEGRGKTPPPAGEVSKDGWSRSGIKATAMDAFEGMGFVAKRRTGWDAGRNRQRLARRTMTLLGRHLWHPPARAPIGQFSGTRPAYQLFSTRNTLQGSALIPTDQRTSSWLPAIVRSSIRQVPADSSAWKTCRFAKRANSPCNLPGARRIRSSATAMGCSCSNVGDVADRTAEARTPTVSRIMAAFC
jgi:hypothetical protein